MNLKIFVADTLGYMHARSVWANLKAALADLVHLWILLHEMLRIDTSVLTTAVRNIEIGIVGDARCWRRHDHIPVVPGENMRQRANIVATWYEGDLSVVVLAALAPVLAEAAALSRAEVAPIFWLAAHTRLHNLPAIDDICLWQAVHRNTSPFLLQMRNKNWCRQGECRRWGRRGRGWGRHRSKGWRWGWYRHQCGFFQSRFHFHTNSLNTSINNTRNLALAH